jgi:hypothetical protein
MGKSALIQLVSMAVQLKKVNDVATLGGRCNGNPQERPIALHTPLHKRGRPRPRVTRAPLARSHPSRHLHSPTPPLRAVYTPRCVNINNYMTSGRTPFRLWSEERTTAGDVWDVKRFEAIVGPDSREAAWVGRRRHSPRGRRLPAEWKMDQLYLRLLEEEEHARK